MSLSPSPPFCRCAASTTTAIHYIYTAFTISELKSCDDYVAVSTCALQAELYPSFPHFEKLPVSSCKHSTSTIANLAYVRIYAHFSYQYVSPLFRDTTNNCCYYRKCPLFVQETCSSMQYSVNSLHYCTSVTLCTLICNPFSSTSRYLWFHYASCCKLTGVTMVTLLLHLK